MWSTPWSSPTMVGSAVLKIIWSRDASSMATISPANTGRMLRLFSDAATGELAAEMVSELVIGVCLPSQTQTPTDCGDLAARPAQPARTLPAVWGTAALRGPPTRLPHPVGDLVPGHPQGADPRGHHRTRPRPDDTPPRTRPLRPTSPRRPGAGSRPVDARCLPAHAGCLSRVPR